MAIVRLFANLRRIARLRETEVKAHSIGEALETLCASYPGMEQAVFDEQGNVRPYVRVMVNGHDIALAQGLNTPVTPADEIAIFPPIGGGKGERVSR